MADVFSFEHYVMVEMGLVVMGALFLIWKRPTSRLRLRLKSAGAGRNGIVPFQSKRSGLRRAPSPHARPTMLNIHFNFNGHSFDAYEVLGLPAGSTWDKVERAYQRAADACDPSSRDFLQAAYLAIEKHLQNSA